MWTLCLLFPANLWVLDCWAGRMSHMNKSVSALGCKLNMLSILFNSVFGKRLPTVLREFVFHPPKNGEEKCSAYTWHQLWHVYTKYTWLCQTSNDLGLADLRTALLLIHDELVHGDLTEIRMNGFWIDGIISVDMHSLLYRAKSDSVTSAIIPCWQPCSWVTCSGFFTGVFISECKHKCVRGSPEFQENCPASLWQTTSCPLSF